MKFCKLSAFLHLSKYLSKSCLRNMIQESTILILRTSWKSTTHNWTAVTVAMPSEVDQIFDIPPTAPAKLQTMHPTLPLPRTAHRRTIAFTTALVFGAIQLLAQNAATGTLTGRVHDSVAGRSLEKARVTVVGSSRETFTDAFGEYRLTGLPPGAVALIVFYTGLVPQTATVKLASGGTAQRDFALTASGANRAGAATDGVVTLDQFVVASARETNASAIAINEQRFAPSAKSVISTDALGTVAKNNIGEFVKFLPGVDVVTDQMNAIGVSLRGMPQAYTGISVDGEPMNVATTSGPSRATSLQTISLVNATRIEIYKVPTPDMPASSLGGSINLISRTAFE
ncbi:MAG: hypothetical protein EXS37_20030 [Opitutus sp.]|nr:hypothetical protein [Opitutus sp.]